MNEKDFLENYLWPSESRLNTTFTHPLPNLEGLKKCGVFIVQSELEETFTPTIITKYVSDTLGVRLVEAYRSTHHKDGGVFVRPVGTISLVKMGYPFLLLDAGVVNVNLLTAEREDLKTTVRISLPQADHEQMEMFFSHFNEQANKAGIYGKEMQFDATPDFYGPMWRIEAKGLNLDMIRQLRDYAWNSYKSLIEQTREKTPFDYKLLQEHMIFDAARLEERLFKRIGLSVPVEAYSAFFSVMLSGV